MSDLREIHIAELGLTITGKTPSSKNPEDFGGDYMFITPSDSFDNKTIYYTNRYLSREGLNKLKGKKLPAKSVLVSCIGSAMGKVTMNNSVSVTNQQINSIIVNSKFDADYVYYCLKNNYKLLRNAASGSTALPMLNKTDFDKLKLVIHNNKSYQNKIAKVLSDLDAKIELNNKINAELEAMAKLIYDYWFVQFEFPNEAGKPYKSSGGKMLKNEELKREVPEGWEVKNLEKCLDKIVDYRGKTPKKLGYDWSNNSDDIVALSAKHVKGGKLVNLKQANRVDKTLFDIWMKDLLREGDILMTSEAPCGEFFYLVGKTEYCLSQRLFAIRSNNKIVHHSYLYFELSSGNGYSQIQGKMSGSTVFGIRQDELRTVKVLIPEMKMQLAFFEQISKMYLQIRNNEYQNQKLAELRDWLLPMLMNGQVRVGANYGQEEEIGMAAEASVGYGKTFSLNKKREAIAACIIINSEHEERFGKVKFEKLLHLSEYHIVKDNLGQNYQKHAAGPLDTKFTYGFINEAKSQGLISIDEKQKLQRIKLKDKNQLQKLADSELSSETQLQIGELVRLFIATNFERPEIVSTLYAVWNNRIINNEMNTDELLKQDFLAWSEGKAKYKDKLDKELNWMRGKGLVPDGWGEVI